MNTGLRLPARLADYLILLPVVVFMVLCSRNVLLPGIYYDEVNPDFQVVSLWMKLMGKGADIPAHITEIVGYKWPLISTYYIGMLPVYLTAPIHALLGYSVETLRFCHALFGAAIVALSYAIIFRATASRWAAMMGALLLAMDAGFVLSFRTQYFITLVALPLLLCAVLILVAQAGRMRPWPMLGAGVCYGLACWTHLTLLFFGLGFFAAAFIFRQGLTARAAVAFVVGAALGLAPWAWAMIELRTGYASNSDFVASFASIVHFNLPLTERMARIAYSLGLTVNNGWQPAATAGTFAATALVGWKLTATLLLVLAAAVAIVWRGTSLERRAALLLLSLVASFAAIAPFAGDRVNPWHLGVNLPLLYVAIGVSIPAWSRILDGLFKPALAMAVVTVMLGISLVQQAALFRELERTGGVSHFSEVRNLLPHESMKIKADATMFFPDWGYLLPAIYLTGGTVPMHSLPGDMSRVKTVLCSGKPALVVVDADTSSRAAVAAAMAKLGVVIESWRQFRQRDGKLNTETAVMLPSQNRGACPT